MQSGLTKLVILLFYGPRRRTGQREIRNRQDSAILPAWVAGHSACRILFILLARGASHIIKILFLMLKCYTSTGLTCFIPAVHKTFKVNWLLKAPQQQCIDQQFVPWFHIIYSLITISYLLASAPFWGFQPDSKAEPEAGSVGPNLVLVPVFVHHLLQELCKNKRKKNFWSSCIQCIHKVFHEVNWMSFYKVPRDYQGNLLKVPRGKQKAK